jgi:hypothetical protein
VTEADAVTHRSLRRHCPRLRRTLYRVTSSPADEYNCFAWAAGEIHRRWDPTRRRTERNYWPVDSRSTALEDAVAAFEAVGFRRVDDSQPTAGHQTIMLYVSDGHITHAARLLENGCWTSKLGTDIDIEHDTLDALAGGLYGEPAVMLDRPAQRAPV